MKNALVIAIGAAAVLSSGFAANGQGENTPLDPEINTPYYVVKTFLTAYLAGDHEKFVSLVHPDVVWVQPGDNRISGIKKSKTELLQMGAKMAELSARTLKLKDVQYFEPHGNTVVCILHWTAAQPTGSILDVRNVDVYTVENGKIILARIYSEDIDQENAFWGK
jgi:ketosteroid isomerase-like protein